MRRFLEQSAYAAAMFAIFVGGISLTSGPSAPFHGPAGEAGMLAIIGVIGCAFLLVYMYRFGYRYWTLPVREQIDYLKRSGQPPVTAEQQRLLSLAAASDISGGTWNSSLAWAPTWTFMDAESQERRRAEPAWSPYRLLELVDPALLRDTLDASFGITRPDGVELAVDQALGSASMSSRLLAVLNDEANGTEFVDELAQHSGWAAERIRSLAVPEHGRPPRLLWAGDVSRAAWIIRSCYMTGLVDEDRAWELLRECERFASQFYDSFSEYLEDVRLADIARTGPSGSAPPWESLEVHEWPAARIHTTFSPAPAATAGGGTADELAGRGDE